MSKLIEGSFTDGVNMFLHQQRISSQTPMFLTDSEALISSVSEMETVCDMREVSAARLIIVQFEFVVRHPFIDIRDTSFYF